MSLYRALAHSGCFCNLSHIQLLDIAEEKYCALTFTQVLYRPPYMLDLFLREHPLFCGAVAAGQPLAGFIDINSVCARVAPELQSPIPPVILLQVDGNPHQPSKHS